MEGNRYRRLYRKFLFNENGEEVSRNTIHSSYFATLRAASDEAPDEASLIKIEKIDQPGTTTQTISFGRPLPEVGNS